MTDCRIASQAHQYQIATFSPIKPENYTLADEVKAYVAKGGVITQVEIVKAEPTKEALRKRAIRGRLIKFLEDSKLTHDDVAEEADVPSARMTNIIHNYNQPSISLYRKVNRAISRLLLADAEKKAKKKSSKGQKSRGAK